MTLNYENSKVVNFTSLKDILEEAPPVHVHNPFNYEPDILPLSSVVNSCNRIVTRRYY